MSGTVDSNESPRRRHLLVFDLNGLFVERVRGAHYAPLAASGMVSERAREVVGTSATSTNAREDDAPSTSSSSPVSSRTRGASERVRAVKPDFRINKHACYLRRHAREFLEWAHERFDVGVWSSAMEHNTSAMVKNIWGDLREKLAFVLCQEHCTRAGMMKTSDGFGTKPRFLKNLSVVWQKFETRFDETNTLLIDDDSYKVVKNPPNTAIHPSPFTVADRESDNGLGPNGALRLYLEKLHECDSVPAFVKTNPFVDAAPRAVADDIETVGARLEALSVRDGAKKAETENARRRRRRLQQKASAETTVETAAAAHDAEITSFGTQTVVETASEVRRHRFIAHEERESRVETVTRPRRLSMSI